MLDEIEKDPYYYKTISRLRGEKHGNNKKHTVSDKS
jgi:hypothetical protein